MSAKITPLGKPGGLSYLTTGRMPTSATGGIAVLLLHGWGAPDDDLVPLAEELAHRRARFFLPTGPLVEAGGGRAWWHLDSADRPAHAWQDQPTPGQRPHHQVTAVRAALIDLLRAIDGRHHPDEIVVGGFSQGAMLALDVALAAAAIRGEEGRAAPLVHRAFALSGVLLEDSLPFLHGAGTSPLPILIAHGRDDQVVPFRGGLTAKELLERHGHAVTWRPFSGGHEIPGGVVDELRTFLFVRT
jgi:phospholipase/carboxylesterase